MKYDILLLAPVMIFKDIEAFSENDAIQKAEGMLIHLTEDILDPEEPYRLIAMVKEEDDDTK